MKTILFNVLVIYRELRDYIHLIYYKNGDLHSQYYVNKGELLIGDRKLCDVSSRKHMNRLKYQVGNDDNNKAGDGAGEGPTGFFQLLLVPAGKQEAVAPDEKNNK